VDGIEQTEMTKQFSSRPWQRLGQARLAGVVVHQHNRAAPLGEQRGRGRAGRTAADDDRIDLCVIARLHDPRPEPGSPVSSAFQIAEGSSRAAGVVLSLSMLSTLFSLVLGSFLVETLQAMRLVAASNAQEREAERF